MAACLVTISGSTGQVLINYIDAGSDPRSVIAGPGTLYLEDDGSDYEWTTLSGDAAVSSGCVSFTEVPNSCYMLSWEEHAPSGWGAPTLNFDAVILGTDIYTIDESRYPGNVQTLAENINALNLDFLKATGYKVVSGTNLLESFLILTVRGADDVPQIRIKNEDDTHHLYLIGETSTCLPAGYTAIDTCEIGTVLS